MQILPIMDQTKRKTGNSLLLTVSQFDTSSSCVLDSDRPVRRARGVLAVWRGRRGNVLGTKRGEEQRARKVAHDPWANVDKPLPNRSDMLREIAKKTSAFNNNEKKTKTKTKKKKDDDDDDDDENTTKDDDDDDDGRFDVLVIGGGATGSGVALDAQTRGLNTIVVERGFRVGNVLEIDEARPRRRPILGKSGVQLGLRTVKISLRSFERTKSFTAQRAALVARSDDCSPRFT